MREILFRGFNESEDGVVKAFYNGEWHKGFWGKGDLIHSGNKYYIHPLYNMVNVFNGVLGDRIVMRKVIPETVGQYVGNGTGLYVGDIVRSGVYIGVVKLGEYGYNGDLHFGYFIDWDKKSNPYNILRQDLMYWANDDLEVIGNIHSNPELLEVG